ncbi:GntR family transcriptional regulator [Roseicyclus persicicus]|uniref:GntR family transcriptional regulator n=1 Tax=Roseicyclus persicicus TaxID=2650661 RepID=A0A7X6K058_9RHOB|nr:GntR family transcriptional regulator [Roseibacterium persicicum]NKX45478.1 GntR family transcriptional regulator [Roseibacterium persicicum]
MARTPLYKAAETEMIRRIRDGDWPVGLRLPNEFVLAAEFGISQGTMRRALMTLEGMGLLSRKPGRGTLVADPGAAPAPAAPRAGRLTGPDGGPLALEVYRSRAGLRGATPAEAALFGTGRLSSLERTLRRAGSRVALDEIVVPEALIDALDEDAAVDLADLLQDAGLAPAGMDDRIAAAVTSMGDSVALACDRYTALLILTRTARDAEGRPLARQTLRLVADGITYDA